MAQPSWPDAVVDAIVLAGGAGRRFGSDKLVADLDGRPLLAYGLAALAPARTVVAVGTRRDLPPTTRLVRWVQEDPPGGGPVAAVVVGMAALQQLLSQPADVVLVLAGDQPRPGPALPDLVRAALGTGAAVLIDADGRAQPLLAAYRPAVLTAALDACTGPDSRGAGVPARRVLDAVPQLARVADVWGAATDVDTPADLERLDLGAAGDGPARGGVEWTP